MRPRCLQPPFRSCWSWLSGMGWRASWNVRRITKRAADLVFRHGRAVNYQTPADVYRALFQTTAKKPRRPNPAGLSRVK